MAYNTTKSTFLSPCVCGHANLARDLIRCIMSILERLRSQDPELSRLDITSGLFSELSHGEKSEILRLLPRNTQLQSIHLSGLGLEDVLAPEQIQELGDVIKSMEINDLCVFRGGSTLINEDYVAGCVPPTLKVLLLWHFASLHEHPLLAKELRQHETLERLTLTLPHGMPWACLDIYAMAFSSMKSLQVLQIRCQGGRQEDSLVSPEAMALLFGSSTISSLYMENCALLDDHMDIFAAEMPENTSLTLLDFQDNLFTDDALYTTGRILPKLPKQLRSINLSGAMISEAAGQVVAQGLSENQYITHLELEGTAQRFRDEFDVPVGHSQDPWMQQIYYHLRLNRALTSGEIQTDKKAYVEALNSVSDQLDCVFHFVRSHPKYMERCGHDTRTFITAPQIDFSSDLFYEGVVVD